MKNLKKINFHRLKICILLAPLFSQISEARDREIEVKVYGRNNLAYELPVETFTIDSAMGRLEQDTFTIDREPIYHTGCAVKSPWLKVGTTERSLTIVPRLTIRWWGVFGEDDQFEYDLAEIRVYSRKNPDETSQKRFVIHTGMLQSRWINTRPNGDHYVHANFESQFGNEYSSPHSQRSLIFGSVRLDPNSEFQVALCNITESTEIKLNSFVALSEDKED